MVVRKSDIKQSNTTTVQMGTEEDVIVLLQDAADVCYRLGMLMQHEKNVYHSRGFQGFKRCFRYASRQYFERAMCLECTIIDNFGGMPMSEAEFTSPGYEGTCLEHMTHVCGELEKAEEELCEIIAKLVEKKEYYAMKCIDKCLCSIQKELKYMYRHLNYMKDIKGDMSQLHWYSKELHDDIKDLEETKHNRYY